MRFIRFVHCLLLWTTTVLGLSGQTEGDIWVMGYRPFIPGADDFGIAFWDFKNAYPIIEYDLDLLVYLQETNASISSDSGEVLLITNGMEVQTRTGDWVIDTIAFLDGGENWSYYFENEYIHSPWGFPKIQTAIILPVPDHPDEYSVIYYHGVTHPELLFFRVAAVLEARLRRLTDDSWEVLYKDKVILEHYEFLSQGTWHACRHANGRDWWLPIHDFEGTTNYSLLLDPNGWRVSDTQELVEKRNLSTNSWFSPDGFKYAKYVNTATTEQYLYIYDFDRCTGFLNNQIEIRLTGEIMIYQGIAFSPNSRYLFAGVNAWELYQYDLWAPDIEASRMLVDTNDGYVEPNWFNTTFGPMMPGPDGRIYMFPISGSSRAVHVIDRPNERGKDARLLQHYITLQTSNARSVQNFANFRLGPLDGSACDTLGLDNHPVSWWRHEMRFVDPLEIRFTDLSYFRPEVWEWDFGDGEMSNDKNPIHTYPSPGLYYACLTVSNEYSTDSSCHWIEIESVSTEDAERDEVYIVHPNPFTDYIEITPPDGYNRYRTLHVTIIDIHGRVVASPEMTCPCRLKLGSIPAGVYFYTLEEGQKVVGNGKMAKAGGG